VISEGAEIAELDNVGPDNAGLEINGLEMTDESGRP